MTALEWPTAAPAAAVASDGTITMVVSRLPITSIRIDGGTQSRVALHEPTVADYAEIVRGGGQLPAVVVFDDGAEVWLADGFHRWHGHKAAGVAEILCEVNFGSRRDAVLYSVGANVAHGLRRTNADKRRAVSTLLEDAEWSAWSDNAIAKACGVSDKTVTAHRASIFGISEDRPGSKTRTVERNGVTYEQNTANIGKGKPDSPSAASAPPPMPAMEGADQSASTTPAAPAPPDEEPEHVGPSDEEVAAALKAEAEQAEYIKDLLAREDDPLTIALTDLAQARRLNAVLESQNAGHQNTINQQIGIIKSLRKKLAKLEGGK